MKERADGSEAGGRLSFFRTLAVLTTIAVAAGVSACSPSPPLTRNLPAEFAVADRVSAGSSAGVLVRELNAQGFKPIDMLSTAPPAHWYGFSRDGFPCRYVWYVTWTTDATNRITRSGGIYRGEWL